MGSSSSKPTAGRDAARTAAAQSLAETHAEVLTSIPLDGGSLLLARAGDEAYHAQRSTAFCYNDSGYPCAIFLPAHARDVAAIVAAVAPLKLDLAIAGGKHSAVCLPDNAIVIDLSRLVSVTPNTTERWVDVGGGAKIGAVDAALAGTGFGIVGGTHPDTGVGGSTQAGGWGWLGRQHGMAVDHWLEADVVLPSGELVVVNDTNEHKDLMRALRGGGNFGVVTRFRFALHPVDVCDYGILVRMSPTISSATATLRAFAAHMVIAPSFACGQSVLPCGAPVVINVFTAVGSKDVVNDNGAWIESTRKLSGPWFSPVNTIIRGADYHKDLQQALVPHAPRGYTFAACYSIKDLNDAMVNVLVHFTRV
ncbi:Aste57867_4619 [Aphanomyces stellatus]|uniref:Aste57867_4619 protein n=1 Tax=Aphanomyces stellatus TaxID=120398 RepID=A0A485KGX1_9STRA|nr:hypothetical protein As57867_004606 [Aphanomyces stellatus]VFT81724.1 Aste57867_4619 [Aphanomyces stellatus]